MDWEASFTVAYQSYCGSIACTARQLRYHADKIYLDGQTNYQVIRTMDLQILCRYFRRRQADASVDCLTINNAKGAAYRLRSSTSLRMRMCVKVRQSMRMYMYRLALLLILRCHESTKNDSIDSHVTEIHRTAKEWIRGRQKLDMAARPLDCNGCRNQAFAKQEGTSPSALGSTEYGQPTRPLGIVGVIPSATWPSGCRWGMGGQSLNRLVNLVLVICQVSIVG